MNTLFWVLLAGLGIWLWFRMISRGGGCCGGGGSQLHGKEDGRESSHPDSGSRQIVQTAVDPVCKMVLDKETVVRTLDQDGRTYSFCSADCYEKFKASPERYLPEHQPVS